MAANSNLWPPEIQNLEMHLGIAKGITTHSRVICMHEHVKFYMVAQCSAKRSHVENA